MSANPAPRRPLWSAIAIRALLAAGLLAAVILTSVVVGLARGGDAWHWRRLLTYHLGGYVSVHGFRLYLDPNDRVMTPAFIQDGTWEPVLTRTLLENLREGQTVVDVGANIGYYTLLAARRVGAGGKVIAFEPDPGNFRLLQCSVAANGLANVVLEQKALSNARGTLKLWLSDKNRGDHTLFPADRAGQGVEVEALPLDEYLPAGAPLDFIKIDTQGAEGVVVEGMRRALRERAGVRLAVEFWPYGLSLAASSGPGLLSQLGELGFQMQDINEPAGRLLPAQPAELLARYTVANRQFTNLLLTRGR